jgi:hypothetical protein
MTRDDAIRELVRAIRGNPKANEALDRFADNGSPNLRERIAIERAAR